MIDKQQFISAQVVLRPASGRVADGKAVITSETIKDFVPSVEVANSVMQGFNATGFQLGSLAGNSFSITAPVNTFERVFHTQFRRDGRGGVEAMRDDGSGTYELTLHTLPTAMSQHIVAVTFTQPPAFGPAGSGP
jgi:hypothetical protein